MTIAAWEGYWKDTPEAAAHRVGGRHEPLLREFWSGIAAATQVGNRPRRILDIGCGNGAALGYVIDAAHGSNLEAFGADGSLSALKDLLRRHPFVRAIVADAVALPFVPGTFDLVISQFGVEYAGVPAVEMAGSLVAPGGSLALVMHQRGGGIDRECEQNLEAIRAVEHMLPRARAALLAGIALVAGTGSKGDFEQADRDLAPAVRAVENVLRQHGRDVAGGFVLRLYQDIGQIHGRPGGYVADEVDAWLGRMALEVHAYRERMLAMRHAAVDEAQYNECVELLESRGLQPVLRSTLGLGAVGQAGWLLVAARAPGDALHHSPVSDT